MPLEDLPHPSHHRSWIEVDLDAVSENVRRFLRLAGEGGALMPAVKADAYGHGAVAVARETLRAGASRLAVASCQEGEELRAAGIGAPVLILGASLPEEVPRAVQHELGLGIHDLEIARLASLEGMRQSRRAVLHLKIDTGMGRLGILPENAVDAAREIAGLPNVTLEGVYMHFADATDEAYSREQLRRFRTAADALHDAGVRPPLLHAANSAGAILHPDARFDLIRPGAGVYGYHNPGWLRERCPLVPALSWRCAIVQLKDYPPGSHLGYNRTFTTRRPTRVAVLPVGYADGYLREFSNRADVLVAGRRAPVVGLISMDYAMADVTGIPDIHKGSVVTLLGADGEERITAEELASRADTIPYFITTGLGRRPGRCYIRRSAGNQPRAEAPPKRLDAPGNTP